MKNAEIFGVTCRYRLFTFSNLFKQPFCHKLLFLSYLKVNKLKEVYVTQRSSYQDQGDDADSFDRGALVRSEFRRNMNMKLGDFLQSYKQLEKDVPDEE